MDQPTLVTCTLPTGVAGSCHDEYRYQNIRDAKHNMADYDLEALSLTALKKMEKDVVKAISTYEDRQKAEARTKVEPVAREVGYC